MEEVERLSGTVQVIVEARLGPRTATTGTYGGC